MNLVTDIWLPCKFKDGSVKEISIAEITNPDVIDLALPRADFQGAAYQLLIGLLQTVIAPENRKEWHQRYSNPPTREELQKQLDKVAHAFNVTGDGPLFMQDFDPLEDVKPSSINGLFIDGPGENGIKRNTDHFVKRSVNNIISLPMAALALFAWQVNGVAFGTGYRVGLRGGGPLTNLIVPNNNNASLWKKVWLNVINKVAWPYEAPDLNSEEIFPWLGETRSSNKPNSKIYPAKSKRNDLTVYWAMPNRIRLILCEENEMAICDLTGKKSRFVVKEFKKKNYGNQYPSESWSHPLTPYAYDVKKGEHEKYPIKPNSDGITYNLWTNLVFTSKASGQICSKNIKHFYQAINRRKTNIFGDQVRLWCFGFDMSNREAKCWYSSTLPLIDMEFEKQSDLLRAVKELQELTNKFRRELNKRIKEAWFERPGDAKGDTTFIAAEFWRRTENIFFDAVQRLSEQESYYPLSTETASVWLKGIQKIVTDLFDEYTLSVDIGDPRILKRVMKARRFLSIWVYDGRDIKNFKQQHEIDTKKEVA